MVLLPLPLLLGVASSAASRVAAPPPHALVTAIVDPPSFGGPGAPLAFARTRLAGATAVRIPLRWREVAPGGAERPAEFDPSNPGDPAYRWTAFEEQVRLAVGQRLEPIVSIVDAPLWAQNPPAERTSGGDWNVSPDELARFASAAATRFSGTFEGLPRIRYWQVWNEPNLSVFLNPQLSTQLTKTPSVPFDPDEVVSPGLYRDMVNAFAAAVHGVRPDNVVIAGGLEPFSGTSGVVAVGAYLFMRKFLCMSGGATPKPTCDETIHFDVWSTHPYTSGGPTHRAALPDDLSLGDLPRAARLLKAAAKGGHVVSSRPVEFWATEFGWDTAPPDPYAVPLRLHARWVAEALYRMWVNGVSLVTWYGVRDEANEGRPHGFVIQSGLYFRGDEIAQDRPKPALAAFRFPFVAFRSARGILVWGRTPWGRPSTVVVEQSSKSGWKRRTRLRTDRFGIFTATLPVSGPGNLLRARLVGGSSSSVPFSLTRPPDRVVNPFGGPPGCAGCG